MSVLMGIGSAIAGAIGGSSQANKSYHKQKKLNQQQLQNQMMLNRQGHDLQMDMWNKTNYEAQIKKMEEAGLNPALMYGMSGGGGTTTGSQGGGSAQGGNAGQERVMDLSNALMMAEIELKKSQANKNDEDAKKTGGVDTEEAKQRIANMKESKDYVKLQSEYQKILNANKQDEIDAYLKNIGQETENLKQKFDLTKEQFEDLVLEQKGKAIESINNGKLIDAKTKLTTTETQAVNERLDIAYSQLELESARVGMNMDAISYDKIRTMVTKEFTELNYEQRKKEMWTDLATQVLTEIIRGAFNIKTKSMWSKSISLKGDL
jgi:hypothetical protein